MTTKEKVDELLDVGAHAFTNNEIDFLANVTDQEEFSPPQKDWVDDLYEKHFGKDDGKL